MVFITLASKKINKSERSGADKKSALGLVQNGILKKSISVILSLVFWFTVWYALASYIDKEIILPKPTHVFSALVRWMNEAGFWLSCGTTVLRIIIGTSLGCVSGIILALVMIVSETVKVIFSPLIFAIKATPVASFIITALYWLSRGDVPAFISFLIVLPIVCDAVYTGIKNTDRGLIEVAEIYRFSLPKKILHLYIPSAMPYFLSSVRTSVGMAWKSGVAAEVLCTPANSIGRELYHTKVIMETSDTFAWTLIIILLSVIFEKITVLMISRGLEKYGDKSEGNNA